jgi:hypothetical protein
MKSFEIRVAVTTIAMSLLLPTVGIALESDAEIVVMPHTFRSRWHLGKPTYTSDGNKILVESNHSVLHVHSARDLHLIKSIRVPDRFAPNVQLVSLSDADRILVLANLQAEVGGSYASELSIVNIDADEPEFRTLRTSANAVQEFENCDQMLSVALNSNGNAVIGGMRPLRNSPQKFQAWVWIVSVKTGDLLTEFPVLNDDSCHEVLCRDGFGVVSLSRTITRTHPLVEQWHVTGRDIEKDLSTTFFSVEADRGTNFIHGLVSFRSHPDLFFSKEVERDVIGLPEKKSDVSLVRLDVRDLTMREFNLSHNDTSGKQNPRRYLPPKTICPLGRGERFVTIAHAPYQKDNPHQEHSEICLRHALSGKLMSIVSTTSEIWQVASSPSGKEFVTTCEAGASDEENGNDSWRFSYMNLWRIENHE